MNGNSPTDRVLRGGAWVNNTNDVRSSYRYCYGLTPGTTDNNVGFRVARAPL